MNSSTLQIWSHQTPLKILSWLVNLSDTGGHLLRIHIIIGQSFKLLLYSSISLVGRKFFSHFDKEFLDQLMALNPFHFMCAKEHLPFDPGTLHQRVVNFEYHLFVLRGRRLRANHGSLWAELDRGTIWRVLGCDNRACFSMVMVGWEIS